MDVARAPRLADAAEQPVAVERRLQLDGGHAVDGGERDVADEWSVVEIAGPLVGQPVAAIVEALARLAVRRGQVAGDVERSLDLAHQVAVGAGRARGALGGIAAREVGDLGHLEGRRAALHLPVRHRLVAQLGERVVADRQRPLGQRPAAGDREVPGGIQVTARDVRAAQGAEDLLEVAAALVDGTLARRQPVAVDAKRRSRLHGLARRGAQVTEGDDVTVALQEVASGMDLEVALPIRGCIAVELGPDRPAPVRLGVDDDHGLVARPVLRRAGDSDQAGAPEGRFVVEPGDADDDGDAGAEAVVAVPAGRVDVHALGVGGHRRAAEIHAPTRGRVMVGAGVVVVRERGEALLPGAEHEFAPGMDRDPRRAGRDGAQPEGGGHDQENSHRA